MSLPTSRLPPPAAPHRLVVSWAAIALAGLLSCSGDGPSQPLPEGWVELHGDCPERPFRFSAPPGGVRLTEQPTDSCARTWEWPDRRIGVDLGPYSADLGDWVGQPESSAAWHVIDGRDAWLVTCRIGTEHRAAVHFPTIWSAWPATRLTMDVRSASRAARDESLLSLLSIDFD